MRRTWNPSTGTLSRFNFFSRPFLRWHVDDEGLTVQHVSGDLVDCSRTFGWAEVAELRRGEPRSSLEIGQGDLSLHVRLARPTRVFWSSGLCAAFELRAWALKEIEAALEHFRRARS